MPTKTTSCKGDVGCLNSMGSWNNLEFNHQQDSNNANVDKELSTVTNRNGIVRSQSRFNKRPTLHSHTSTLYQPTKSKFIGSFIHEYCLDSRVKQRPSKRARQRMRKRTENLKLEGDMKYSPDSGYNTTSGDCHTPKLSVIDNGPLNATNHKESPWNGSVPSSSTSVPPSSNQMKGNAESTSAHSRTTSSSSAGSCNIADVTFKKLLKDLHRCEVSINKYESMLSEKCDKGLVQLNTVMGILRRKFDARENDLIQELKFVRESAATILQRRKNTASFLKQAAERLNTLNDSQITELKQQIKQFVTDRKVDEEIGTITRFHADPDDLLPQIMGFGKVDNVRHLYTKWEENPAEAIEMSKYRFSFSCTTFRNFCFSTSSNCNSESLRNTDTDTTSVADVNDTKMTSDSAFGEMQNEHSLSTDKSKSEEDRQSYNDTGAEALQDNSSTQEIEKIAEKSKCVLLPKVVTAALPIRDELVQKPLNHDEFVVKPNHSSNSENANSVSSALGACHKVKSSLSEFAEEKIQEAKTDESCGKMSPTELILKQERVRESLKKQGVFLYDPITGAGPVKSTDRLLDVAIGTDIQLPTSPAHSLSRKTKTPTQLRRERKKRQKAREHRQNELERKSREDLSTPNGQSSLSYSHIPEVPHSLEKISCSSPVGNEQTDAPHLNNSWKSTAFSSSGGETKTEDDSPDSDSCNSQPGDKLTNDQMEIRCAEILETLPTNNEHSIRSPSVADASQQDIDLEEQLCSPLPQADGNIPMTSSLPPAESNIPMASPLPPAESNISLMEKDSHNEELPLSASQHTAVLPPSPPGKVKEVESTSSPPPEEIVLAPYEVEEISNTRVEVTQPALLKDLVTDLLTDEEPLGKSLVPKESSFSSKGGQAPPTETTLQNQQAPPIVTMPMDQQALPSKITPMDKQATLTEPTPQDQQPPPTETTPPEALPTETTHPCSDSEYISPLSSCSGTSARAETDSCAVELLVVPPDQLACTPAVDHCEAHVFPVSDFGIGQAECERLDKPTNKDSSTDADQESVTMEMHLVANVDGGNVMSNKVTDQLLIEEPSTVTTTTDREE